MEVTTPERLLMRELVAEAQIPAANGYVGILPGHAALLAELGAGKLSYRAGGHRRSLTVQGGWLEVAGDHVRVLADRAEQLDQQSGPASNGGTGGAHGKLKSPE